MRMDELEQQAQSMTQTMTGREMARISKVEELLSCIASGEVFLTFADTQWVTTRLTGNRVFFFNPESTELPVGSLIPSAELPQRRVEDEGEQSIDGVELTTWFSQGRVRALRVI